MSDFNSNIYNRGDISFLVDDVEANIVASAISFTIRDSIYELYPKASFTIDDTWGYFNEYMGFVNGTKIEIRYGLNKDSLRKQTFRVLKNSTPEITAQGCAGGKMELSLVHDYFYNQNKVSKSYDNNISSIVRQLANKYKFNSLNIGNTLNSAIWYQPYVTDAEFIMNYMLPYAYSTDSDDSPFYCFIDNKNNFNFKNYKSMFNGSEVQSFFVRKKGTMDYFEKDTIRDVHYSQNSVKQIRPFLNRTTCYWDDSGKFVSEKDVKITRFPKNAKNIIPIKANLDCTTNVQELLDDDIILKENTNNRKAQVTNVISNVISSDKVIISINFNNNICCGELVKLNLPSIDSNSTSEVSLRNSGIYLVESSYQKWDGLNFYTILVCSKQDLKLTNIYRNIGLVVNR